MQFTANGRQFTISHQDVVAALEGVTPEPETKWMVEVAGRSFPVKQALSVATGLGRGEFISTVAQTKLAALGFEVHRSTADEDEEYSDELLDARSEVEVLVDAVRDMEIGVLGSEYGYSNLVLCLIDAIFSIGIRYTTTRRVVSHFIGWWDTNAGDPAATSAALALSDFALAVPLDLAETESSARDMAKTVFGHLHRTSSRNGILKAAAILKEADVCLSFGIDNLEDLLAHRDDEQFKSAFRSLPGQGSGISLRYLFMLAGDTDEAKPDRMILRFMRRHLGYQPSPDKAVTLLHDVSVQLQADGIDMDVRRLDHAIWRHESNSSESEKPHTVTAPARSKYAPLGAYLGNLTSVRAELSFGEIEEILGSTLPASARRHSAFWANHYGGTHVWAMQWMDAGWKVDSHSLVGERVVFVKVDADRHM